jgi:hypothetical protein
MGAPIIEEAEHNPLGIELKVGMSPRNGWVGSVPVVPECHVIFSCQPAIRVDNFHKTSQVNALLLQAELLLLGRPGDDGKPDLHHLTRSLRGGNAAVVHIKAPGCYIRWQFRDKFHPHREMRWKFYTLILQTKAHVPSEGIAFDEDLFIRTLKRRVRQKNPHLQLRIREHLLTAPQRVYMSSNIVEQRPMDLQQFTFLVR